ncbi:hypothetical protein O3G_MSEX005538 [Manduca sexta]|uniref:Uncharacterized protein n=1 Tax=Manduca sexta TaxID=7130 RepID=A0A921Z0H4_MANSE|nr:hypothetical protein O3G_MSEX005538 [Manduca sexta]
MLDFFIKFQLYKGWSRSRSGQSPNMMSIPVVLFLGFIACTYAAPEPRPLDESATTLTVPNEENYASKVDDAVDDVMKKMAANDIHGAEKSFRDFVVKAAKADLRLSDPTMMNVTYKDAERKEIGNLLRHALRKIVKEDKNTEKQIRYMLETAAKRGQLDRGFVSDLINSTLGGAQEGFSLDNNNGTTNQLCAEQDKIAITGCHLTAADNEISNDNNRTMTQQKHNPR